MLQELLDAVDDHRFDNVHYRYSFAEQIPGVEIDFVKDTPPLRLFQRVPEEWRDKAIATRRLKSPDHYRIYFALSQPSHALTTKEMSDFWRAVEIGPAETAAALLALHVAPTTRNIGKAEMLLERLSVFDPGLLMPSACENILLGLSDFIDEAYRARRFDRSWVFSLSDRATRVVPILLARLPLRRNQVVSAMFTQGRAITWLTDLLRHDLFYQGRYGAEDKPESEWLFTSIQLDTVTIAMTTRYRAMTFDEVMSTLEPRRLLYTWFQSGDESGLRKLLEPCKSDDVAFLTLLASLQSLIGTSNGRFDVLKRQTLADFLDAEEALSRLEALAKNGPHELRNDASELLASFELGKDY